jgi:hypothetical protein
MRYSSSYFYTFFFRASSIDSLLPLLFRSVENLGLFYGYWHASLFKTCGHARVAKYWHSFLFVTHNLTPRQVGSEWELIIYTWPSLCIYTWWNSNQKTICPGIYSMKSYEFSVIFWILVCHLCICNTFSSFLLMDFLIDSFLSLLWTIYF